MIRKAVLDDAKFIAKIIIKSWQTAYRGIIDDNYLDNLSYEKIEKVWEKNIENQNDNDKIFVYEENSKIQGVIRFGLPQDKSDNKYNAEIHVLYVEPTLKRKGIGSKLFEFAKDDFIKQNMRDLIIWCVKGNIQGINFYSKMGGKMVSSKKSIINNVEIEEVGFKFYLTK